MLIEARHKIHNNNETGPNHSRHASSEMGASGSKTAVAPILPASQLSAAQVAEAVKALGGPYVGYAEKLEENGMDGVFLEETSADDLPGLFEDIGVTSNFHKKKLSIVFNSFKASGDVGSGGGDGNGDSGPASDGIQIQAAHASPLGIIKAFAGFLSHFKLECGTEARLVQLQLKPILEKNPVEGSSNEVFLDSDDLSDLCNLLQHVRQSRALVLLQSKGVPWGVLAMVLTRPSWVRTFRHLQPVF